MTVPGLWPVDATPSTLFLVRVKAKADEVFKTLFTNPELQHNLHKLRNDTNYVESPWLASREELPQPQYTWEAPTVPPGTSIVASNRWRKVRFESPPAAMASKPFQNEEIQHCTEYRPGHRYVVYSQANTSAPYGDKFDVCIKTIVVADEKHSCLLHVSFYVAWSPAMNRMMKAMISKAVDGGVRGTYKQFRQVLEAIHPLEDVAEGAFNDAMAHEPPLEEEAVAAVPMERRASVPQPAFVVPSQPGVVAAMEPTSLLSYAFSQLVWGEQVRVMAGVAGAGMRSAASEGLVARVMAAVVTLSLIHAAVTCLHTVQTFCQDQRHVVWLACLPITHGIDLPDSLGEVLVSLLLVALINYGIIWAAQQSMGASTRASSTAAGSVSAASAVTSGQPATAAASGSKAELDTAAALQPASTAATTAAALATTTAAAGTGSGFSPPVAPSGTAAAAVSGKPVHISKAAPKRADIIPPKGRSSSPLNPAGVPNMRAASALTPLTSTSTSTDGKASKTTPPAITAPPPSMSMPRHGTARGSGSGTTTAPLQMEMTTLPLSPRHSNGGTAASPTAAAAKPIPIPTVSGGPSPAHANGSKAGLASSAAAEQALLSSLTPSPATSPTPASHEGTLSASAPGTAGAKSALTVLTPPAYQRASSTGVASTGSTQPGSAGKPVGSSVAEGVALLSPAPAASPEGVNGNVSSSGSIAKGGRPSTPAAATDASGAATPPLSSTARGSAGGGLSSRQVPAAAGATATAVTTPPTTSPPRSTSAAGTGSSVQGQVFGAQYPPGAIPAALSAQQSGSEPMKAWIKSVSDSMDLLAEGFKGAFGIKPGSEEGMPGGLQPASRSADHSALSPGARSAGTGAGGSSTPLMQLPDGPERVEEEVFENERFQPFRGWGHTWPGHFLPSDRVGHWSDSAGGPGGSASMIFEQVEPVLQPGYMWLEDEWQLDMEGFERDAVDEHGWTYALDFNYLKHPPQQGNGKCTLKHFVRRRRWFRTRVRMPCEMPPLQLQLMSKSEGGSVQGEEELDAGHPLPSSPSIGSSVPQVGAVRAFQPPWLAASSEQAVEPPAAAAAAAAAAVPHAVSAPDMHEAAAEAVAAGGGGGGNGRARAGEAGGKKTRLAHSSTSVTTAEAGPSDLSDTALNKNGASLQAAPDLPVHITAAAGSRAAAPEAPAAAAPTTTAPVSLITAAAAATAAAPAGDTAALMMTATKGGSASSVASDADWGEVVGAGSPGSSPVKSSVASTGSLAALGKPSGRRSAGARALLGKALDAALITTGSVDTAMANATAGTGFSTGQGRGVGGAFAGHVDAASQLEAQGSGESGSTPASVVIRHNRQLSTQSTSSNHPLRPSDSM